MTWYGSTFRNAVIPILEALMGRRNLVRLGRAISMEARLDVNNDMSTNGESMVQECAIRAAQAGRELVVFDVGANIGEWTRSILDKAAGRGTQVHVFEPASATFAQLRQNLAGESRRTVFVNEALSDKKGSADFFVMGAGLGTNSLHPGTGGTKKVETVRLNTVDEYCRQNHISHIDLLKVDAEGHDLNVLDGARGMLAGHAISILQIEYNHRWIGARRYLKDAFELLLPIGYLFGKVTPRGIEFYPAWHFELESFREGNYIACLPECVPLFPAIKWWNLD
jgi:FkbM family methyltransferase